jgi:nitroreductase
MGRVMQRFVDTIESAPVIVLVGAEAEPGHEWIPTDGGSVYPAVQNLLLAARALGYGGIVSLWQRFVDVELRAAIGLPDTALLFATVPLGRPEGNHGPVRRIPLHTVVYENCWGQSAGWAVDPPGTRFSGGMQPR